MTAWQKTGLVGTAVTLVGAVLAAATVAVTNVAASAPVIVRFISAPPA